MCTYNAEKYLEEQLESFLIQTLLPAELIIQDDDSSDRTAAMVESFAKKATFRVSFAKNPTRLGPTGNFEQSMRRCTGDVVVFSDADDIWYRDRLEAAMCLLQRRQDVGCVFCDADLVNSDGSRRGVTLWESIRFTEADQDNFERGDIIDALLRRAMGFGGTMAVRRAAIGASLPIPRPWGHDSWTAAIGSAVYGAALIRRPLIKYRQHSTQYSGASGGSLLERLRKSRVPHMTRDWIPRGSSFEQLADRLDQFEAASPQPAILRDLVFHARRKSAHQKMREELSPRLATRLVPILRDTLRLRYSRYSNGILSALRDLVAGQY